MSRAIKQRPATMWEREPIIMDLRRAAFILGLTEAQLRTLAREGKVPAFKLGACWRFEKSRLMQFAGAAQEV